MSRDEKINLMILNGEEDKYGGVVVNLKGEIDVSSFQASLTASMEKWRQEGKRGIWIKIPIDLVDLVPVAVKFGFSFHHAEKTYLMVTYWIPETRCSLPPYATHRVGIGALVVNDKKEVLVVKEKKGRFGDVHVWKLPTGTVEEGEDIFDGAIREVKEETGIETQFIEVLGFRQKHKAYFCKSDMFFVCVLQPQTDKIVSTGDVEKAEWLPFEDYFNQPFIQKSDSMLKVAELCREWIDRKYEGFKPVPMGSVFSRDHLCYLYCKKVGNILDS